MVGKVVTVLLGGYIALRIAIALIPSITDLDPSTVGGGTGIVYDMIVVAQWLLPLCGVAVICVWGANQISIHWGRHSRSRDDDDA